VTKEMNTPKKPLAFQQQQNKYPILRKLKQSKAVKEKRKNHEISPPYSPEGILSRNNNT